jgi:hypothetical protein
MNYLLSLTISSILGFLLIHLVSSKKPIDPLQKAVLSPVIGLGLSGQLMFYSLIINEAYSSALAWGLHAGVMIILLLLNRHTLRAPKISIDRRTLWGLGAVLLLLIPFWREAHFFPFGGWDAWSCWNLKARFIFLGGEEWKRMLDPVMWQSNNHYPFLLPLINVWGWSFYGEPTVLVPMFNAIALSFLTAVLMWMSINRLTASRWSFLAPVVLFSIPFMVTLSISQYSDILVALYLLTALTALTQARLENNPGWAAISGCCVGLMSFVKTEGMVAGAIIFALAFVYFLAGRRDTKLLGSFMIAALAFLLPTIIFKLLLAPVNAAFTNGLTSAESPSTLLRLQWIGMFLAVELVAQKWNGLWILLLGGIVLSGLKSLRDGRWITPAVLLSFLACALGYYYLNTYFEVLWWLKTSLNRVLYIILPALVWWVFYSLLSSCTTKK